MPIEQFFNDPGTTLDGAIDASQTTLVVSSGTGYPTTGNFRIQIDSELLLVTDVSSLTWTVTRGIEGTTGASHSNGASISHVVSGGGLTTAILDASILSGNRTPAVPGSFTAINGASYTTDTNGGMIVRSLGPGGSGAIHDIKAFVLNAPATPYTVTARLKILQMPINFSNAGLCFRESATGEIVTFGFGAVNGPKLLVDKFNSPTSYNNFYLRTDAPFPTSLVTLKMQDNGTNRIFSYGFDEETFIQVQSHSRTDFMTADQVGFFANAVNTTFDCVTNVVSWIIT